MSDFHAIADWAGIEALGDEFSDAVMRNDHDRLASLFTPDVLQIPFGRHRGRRPGTAGTQQLTHQIRSA